MLQTALHLLALGLSVLPIEPGSKRPSGAWREFMHRRASEAEVEAWFRSGNSNIGIVTGEISGVTVLDVESHGLQEAAALAIPETVTSITQGGGRHYYFRYRPGDRCTTWSPQGRRLGDVKATGGIVVVPPSRGPLGDYVWERSFENIEVAPAPNWLPRGPGRGTTVVAARPVPPRSASNWSSRSEEDLKVAIDLLARGARASDVERTVLARPAASDRGRYAEDYARRTLRAARAWVEARIRVARVARVALTRSKVRVIFRSECGERHLLILDRKPTERSRMRWRALNAAAGFDAMQNPVALTGTFVRLELVSGAGNGFRIGRVYPVPKDDLG